MKATHNGTCQVCGNHQAVNAKNGTLAKHGYRVEMNSFWNTCPGSHHSPLQQCRAKADQIAKSLDEDATKLEATVASGVVERVQMEVRIPVSERRWGQSSFETRMLTYEQFAETRTFKSWDWAVRDELQRLRMLANEKRAVARQIREHADAIHGTELIARS